MSSFGPTSLQRLQGVHPALVSVLKRAIEISKQDFMILEGVRTKARQIKLYAQGRTEPGDIVTWTLLSNHFINEETGYGHAIDAVPYPVDWNTPSKFDAINEAIMQAAKEQGVKIRWGADWDQDGNPRERGETDSPHWELAK